MKRLLFVALISLISTASLAAAEDGKHLFILSGQSNMAGLDPNISFTPTVEKEFGKENVIVVKSAQGGQPIRRWYKKWKPGETKIEPKAVGDLYDVLMSKVNPAIEDQKIESVTFVWMQGERDAKEKLGDVYAASFKGLVKQLSDDLGRDDVNFVIGRLSDCHLTKGNVPHWKVVREAQVEVAEGDPRGAWVDTDDLNGDKDGLHYTKEGYATLGKRFAEEAIKLIKKDGKEE